MVFKNSFGFPRLIRMSYQKPWWIIEKRLFLCSHEKSQIQPKINLFWSLTKLKINISASRTQKATKNNSKKRYLSKILNNKRELTKLRVAILTAVQYHLLSSFSYKRPTDVLTCIFLSWIRIHGQNLPIALGFQKKDKNRV